MSMCLYDRNKILDLLQFTALKLSPLGNILAMGQDGLHTTMTCKELRSIKKYSNMFFSDTALTLNLLLKSSCLGTIYSQDYDNIKVSPTKFLETTEHFPYIAPPPLDLQTLNCAVDSNFIYLIFLFFQNFKYLSHLGAIQPESWIKNPTLYYYI